MRKDRLKRRWLVTLHPRDRFTAMRTAYGCGLVIGGTLGGILAISFFQDSALELILLSAVFTGAMTTLALLVAWGWLRYRRDSRER